jgi:hypothetical protein
VCGAEEVEALVRRVGTAVLEDAQFAENRIDVEGVLPSRVNRRLDADCFSLGGFRLGLRDVADFLHDIEDDVPAAPRGILPRFLLAGCIRGREVVPSWTVDQPGEERGLAQRKLRHVLPEIRPSGRLNSVGSSPEIGRVQVTAQDLLLRRQEFEPESKDCLAQLGESASRPPVKVEVLSQLL